MLVGNDYLISLMYLTCEFTLYGAYLYNTNTFILTFNLKVEVTYFLQDTYNTVHCHMMHKPQNKNSINTE